MKLILLIGLGGGVGAILRYLTSKGAGTLLGPNFPYGTLIVNILGSMLMAFLVPILLNRYGSLSYEIRALLLIGLLGGFTTFSTFSIEAFDLFENGQLLKGCIYILSTLVLCLAGTGVGIALGRKI